MSRRPRPRPHLIVASALILLALPSCAEQAAAPRASGGAGGITKSRDLPPGWNENLPEAPPDNMPFMTLSSNRCKGRNVYKVGCSCRPLEGDLDSQVETLP